MQRYVRGLTKSQERRIVGRGNATLVGRPSRWLYPQERYEPWGRSIFPALISLMPGAIAIMHLGGCKDVRHGRYETRAVETSITKEDRDSFAIRVPCICRGNNPKMAGGRVSCARCLALGSQVFISWRRWR